MLFTYVVFLVFPLLFPTCIYQFRGFIAKMSQFCRNVLKQTKKAAKTTTNSIYEPPIMYKILLNTSNI